MSAANSMENGTGTGYTIPINAFTVVFFFISKVTLEEMTSVLTIISALIGIVYVAYKFYRDVKKAHREDEEYEQEHPSEEEE